MTKKLLFGAVLFVTTFNALAQFNPETANYRLQLDKNNRKKATGIVMIVAGTISAVVGVSQLSTATTTYYSNVNGVSQGDPKVATGTLFTIAGLGLLGGGIPLTIISSRRAKKFQQKLDEVSLHLNLQPQQQGLTLCYRF